MADREVAITLPLEVVERLLMLAMHWTFPLLEEDREAIKLVDREVEDVKRMARCDS